MTTFDSSFNVQALAALSLQKVGLKVITTGKIQLPDFQRGWVWDDNHVQSLLVSIASSFPVGAVMLARTGNQLSQNLDLDDVKLFFTSREASQ